MAVVMAGLSFSEIADSFADCRQRLIVAYSGGVDSHVLLHLCASQAEFRDRLLAVYVDHGLQVASAQWGEHCRHQAAALAIDFVALSVDGRAKSGEGPEAAARQARYAALRDLLQPGDALLLAQHREDQMETLLLQLFRGAGVAGLAAMPARDTFGAGWVLRPLLAIGKREILEYALSHGLCWVDDPSNQGDDFDRNFLRNRVLPLLKQRWPSLDKSIARSAAHCGQAANLLQSWSEANLVGLMTDDHLAGPSLQLDRLVHFAPEQRRWLLRQWLQQQGLRPPSLAQIQAIENQLIGASDSGEAEIQLQGYFLKKYRRRLFCLQAPSLQPFQASLWPTDADEIGLSNGQRLLRQQQAGIAKRLWDQAIISVRPRDGGEKLKLAGRAGHHPLKKLFQEAGVPPWRRHNWPLIYLDQRLAAVAGLWVDEWALGSGDEACYWPIVEYDQHRQHQSCEEVDDVHGA